jgi:hypothetical protein
MMSHMTIGELAMLAFWVFMVVGPVITAFNASDVETRIFAISWSFLTALALYFCGVNAK